MQDTATTSTAAASTEGAGRRLLSWDRPARGVLVLTLVDAANRNTLSEEMLAALQAAIDKISADAETRCVVLAAEGPAFCAGHNLKQMTAHRADADGGHAYYVALMARCATMMQSIVACPKPFIAAVHAPAVAAGCQLVASCDMAVAAAEAKFGTTGINNGLFCSTPMVALSRKVPRALALEMLMLGGLASAEEARGMGLVNRVVPATELLATAIGMATIVASKSAAAIAMGKRAFYRQIELPLAEAYAIGSDALVDNMMHCDAVEGIGAFIDKRTPVWEADR
jgi:enoyl-CoA hydratase/carnithine racemase